MKSSCISPGLAVAAALALSSAGACAAGELQALSDAQMSAIYGQGLSGPALDALSARDQSDSGVSAVAAAAALSELASLSGDLQDVDRQLAQQRLLAAATGVQTTLLISRTLVAADKAVAPIASSVTLPVTGLPLPIALPPPAGLDTLRGKH